ncbi:ribbon-helix-helix domain-containing protein [Labrys monachus]|uniref:DNA-binding ribbon-helix-helix protein n=1 Tax=Labrys monachus TaxID=217067 RepID=A0ABU0FP44_9HYPH|nr:ribbon-helix-helix domain-containing protein [Labrys monachus]MDQ0396383.1 putative DNA-binding ribbon-helix-helix protein [Labrys monachus]
MCHLFASQPPETYETHTRSVRIGGHSTSIRLEAVYWDILEELAAHQNMSLGRFVTRLHDEVLDLHGNVHNFTSLLRCCCLKYVVELRPAGQGTTAPPFGLVAAE